MTGSPCANAFPSLAKLCLALLVPLAGCNTPTTPGASVGGEEATALPAIKVDLPPPPSFEFHCTQEYPDGTKSICGLRKLKDKYLKEGKDVKVKAYLLEVYQCPKCPKGQTCKLCDQPHFFLSDDANGKKEKAMLVVDYLLPKQKPPALTIGKQYVITGTFARNSPTGFADSDGLLLFTQLVDDKGLEFISQAAQLEAKALKGAEQEMQRLKKK